MNFKLELEKIDTLIQLAIQEDIGRFDITMHTSLLVSVIQRRRDLFEVLLRFAQ